MIGTELARLDDRCIAALTLRVHSESPKQSHSFGTPFLSLFEPRSSNTRPEPALDHARLRTSTSPGRQGWQRARNVHCDSGEVLAESSHSPVCRPQGTSRPSERTVSRIAPAQRIARAGRRRREQSRRPKC